MLKQSSFSLPHSHSLSTYTTVPMVWGGSSSLCPHQLSICTTAVVIQRSYPWSHSHSIPRYTQHWWCIFILCALSTFPLYIHNHKKWCRLLLPHAVPILFLFQHYVWLEAALNCPIHILCSDTPMYWCFGGPHYLSSLCPLSRYSTALMGWESLFYPIHITFQVTLMHWWGRVCICSFYNPYNETDGVGLLLLIRFIGPFLLLYHHCTDGAWLLLAQFSTFPR